MNESLSVGDLMRREFVGVNEGDSVAGATKLMHEEQVDSAIVVRGGDPIGILTASDVVGVVARGDDPSETTVDAAMREPVITVNPEDDVSEALGAITDRGVRWLAVVSNGEVIGTLSDHDIVTAPPALTPVGDRGTPEPTEPIEERSEVGLQSETYSTQGVCEVCGALSRNLASQNGQLLCEDCLAM